MPTYQERVNTLLTKSPVEAGKALYKMIESNNDNASRFISAYASKATSTDQIRTMVLTIGSLADKNPVFLQRTLNALQSAEHVGRPQDRIFPLVDMPVAHGWAVRDAVLEWRAPHIARAEAALAKAREDPAWYEGVSPKRAQALAAAARERNR